MMISEAAVQQSFWTFSEINHSQSLRNFVIAVYSLCKYWILLQAFVRICLVFKNIRFTESFIMAASEFGYIWIVVV